MVECSLKVIADLGGLEPGGYGSSSCDGEEDAGDECQKVRPSFCRQCVGESLGDGLEQVNGCLSTLMKHGWRFFGWEWFLQTILYTKSRLRVKTNSEKF